MSDRSQQCLDKYCFDKQIDILAVQESFTSNSETLNLTNMNHTLDTNGSKNRGVALYVNSTSLSLTPLVEISKTSNELDTACGLICGGSFRYIVGSVFLKLSYRNAVQDIMNMMKTAEDLANKHKAKGIMVMGVFNARNNLWDTQENIYGKQLVGQLDFQKFTIFSGTDPTF